MSQDFERVPNDIVRDYAEFGTVRVQSMAQELLIARSCLAAAEAQANSLHAVIVGIIKEFGGPSAISDFGSWIRGELAAPGASDLAAALTERFKTYQDSYMVSVGHVRGEIRNARAGCNGGAQ